MAARSDKANTRQGRRITGCVVAHDGQAATPIRAIDGESSDDGMPARPDRLPHVIEVGGAVGRLSEEMERGAIVPQSYCRDGSHSVTSATIHLTIAARSASRDLTIATASSDRSSTVRSR